MDYILKMNIINNFHIYLIQSCNDLELWLIQM